MDSSISSNNLGIYSPQYDPSIDGYYPSHSRSQSEQPATLKSESQKT